MYCRFAVCSLALLIQIVAGCDRSHTGSSVSPRVKAPASQPWVYPVAKWSMRALPENEVNLLAMGDWGTGGKRQQTVAKAIAGHVERVGTQFNGLLSLGDNFYVMLDNEYDAYFKSVFEDMYESTRINFPFYAVLGNHDYDGNGAAAELAYARKFPESRWRMPARWYRLDLPADKPLVTVLMLDSNRYELPEQRMWFEQIEWLEKQLSGPRAPWTIACAHHPIYSNGEHGDDEYLQNDWGTLFEKHGVDFYLCGHDHDLQHLNIPDRKTTFMVVGGGGAWNRFTYRNDRGPFSRSMRGFAHLQFTPKSAQVQYLDRLGNLIHEFDRARDGAIKVTKNGGQDNPADSTQRYLYQNKTDPEEED